MATLRREGGARCLAVGLWLSAGAAMGESPPRRPSESGFDSFSTLEQSFQLHDAQVEEWFDAVAWTDLDALLLDPVALRRGNVMRLAVVPWLTTSHLETLRRAPALHSWKELARLPGWNEDLARSVLPFVRFEPEGPSWELRSRSRWTTTRAETRWDATGFGWSASLRWRPQESVGQSGFIALQGRRLRAVVGDLRLGVSQGLLWWSSETDLRASSTPLRRPRPLWGSVAADAPRVVRGLGIELEAARLRAQVVRGRMAGKTLTGIVGELVPSRQVITRFCWLDLQEQSAISVAWGWSSPRGRVEAEVLPTRVGRPAVLALERRWGGLRFAARLQHAPEAHEPAMAAEGATASRSSTRHGLLRANGHRGPVRFEWALHRLVRHDSLGDRLESLEQRWSLRWRWKRQSLEIRWRQRHGWEHPLGLEGPEGPVESLQRGLVVRTVHELDGSNEIGLEVRTEEAVESLQDARGNAWQVHFQSHRGVLRGQLALTSFVAPSGKAAPVVADPGIGTVPASRRLVGDGIRIAGALRARTERIEVAARWGRSFLSQPQRLEWETSLHLRLH